MSTYLHRLALWLGLFAVLIMNAGPLISGAQASIATSKLNVEHLHEQLAQELHCHEGAQAVDDTDFHALMGHSSVSTGLAWLDELLMLCGYCELLTLNPLLLLALNYLAVNRLTPCKPMVRLVRGAIPQQPMSVRLSRAPPFLFA